MITRHYVTFALLFGLAMTACRSFGPDWPSKESQQQRLPKKSFSWGGTLNDLERRIGELEKIVVRPLAINAANDWIKTKERGECESVVAAEEHLRRVVGDPDVRKWQLYVVLDRWLESLWEVRSYERRYNTGNPCLENAKRLLEWLSKEATDLVGRMSLSEFLVVREEVFEAFIKQKRSMLEKDLAQERLTYLEEYSTVKAHKKSLNEFDKLTFQLSFDIQEKHQLTCKYFMKLWTELGGRDASRVHQAIWALVAHGDQVVTFIKGQIRAGHPNTGYIHRLIADLDHEDYSVRENATIELRRIGPQAKDLIERASKQTTVSLEVQARASAIVRSIEDGLSSSAEANHNARVIQVLEYIGTKEARELLKSLGTREALAALKRL